MEGVGATRNAFFLPRYYTSRIPKYCTRTEMDGYDASVATTAYSIQSVSDPLSRTQGRQQNCGERLSDSIRRDHSPTSGISCLALPGSRAVSNNSINLVNTWQGFGGAISLDGYAGKVRESPFGALWIVDVNDAVSGVADSRSRHSVGTTLSHPSRGLRGSVLASSWKSCGERRSTKRSRFSKFNVNRCIGIHLEDLQRVQWTFEGVHWRCGSSLRVARTGYSLSTAGQRTRISFYPVFLIRQKLPPPNGTNPRQQMLYHTTSMRPTTFLKMGNLRKYSKFSKATNAVYP